MYAWHFSQWCGVSAIKCRRDKNLSGDFANRDGKTAQKCLRLNFTCRNYAIESGKTAFTSDVLAQLEDVFASGTDGYATGTDGYAMVRFREKPGCGIYAIEIDDCATDNALYEVGVWHICNQNR